MNSKRSAVLVALAAMFFLTSCSGTKNVCTTNCGQNGDATLSVTLAAVPFTPPPGTSILSFVVTINSISLTPSAGGSDVPISLNSGSFSVDLTRLQSDASFLGVASAKIPAGTYNKVTVGITGAVVTYCVATSGTPGCKTGTVAQFTTGAGAPVTSNFSLTLSSNQKAGLRVQINFANALTVNVGTQAVTAVSLNAANVITTLSLPPSASILPSGTLDYVDDVTGVVTAASSTSVTVQTARQGTITATITSATIGSPNCVIQNQPCSPTQGQIASLDATLNPDGTFTLLQFDPLSTKGADAIEGIVTTENTSSTQFQIVTNGFVQASSGSVLSGLSLGDIVNVTLSNSVQPFVIDSKGLPVVNTPFNGGTSATDILPGQTVMLRVTGFTAKSGNTSASAQVDFVVLRFTRVAGTVSNPTGAIFNIGSLPLLFGQTGSSQVQLSSGSPSTELDGYASPGAITSGDNVAIRALFFGTGTVPGFSAAKVRKN